MAVELADCDAMIVACRAAEVLLDGQPRDPLPRVARSRPSACSTRAAIGELRLIRILSSVVAYLPDDHGWTKDPGEGGAWLDMGVHLFDALRWFTGSEVEQVFARIRDFAGPAHLRRSGTAEVDPGNGVVAQLLMSFEMPPPGLGSQNQLTFIGSDGIIESDAYGKVRLGRGDRWEEVYEMPSFALNADVYSPVRLEAFAAQVEELRGRDPGRRWPADWPARMAEPPSRLSRPRPDRRPMGWRSACRSAPADRARPYAPTRPLTPNAEAEPSSCRSRLAPRSTPPNRARPGLLATFPAFCVLADGSLLASYSIGSTKDSDDLTDRAPSIDRRRRDLERAAPAVRDHRERAARVAQVRADDRGWRATRLIVAPLDRSRGLPRPAAVQPGDRGLPADGDPARRLVRRGGRPGHRGASSRCQTTSGRRA